MRLILMPLLNISTEVLEPYVCVLDKKRKKMEKAWNWTKTPAISCYRNVVQGSAND